MSFHFEKKSITVSKTPTGYDVTFKNVHTGAVITMQIPESGVFEDPDKKLTYAQARELAERIAEVLRNYLV